jgi:hypothetical protein
MTTKTQVLHSLENPAVAISVVAEIGVFLKIAKDLMLWDTNPTRLTALGSLAAIPILTFLLLLVPKLWL